MSLAVFLVSNIFIIIYSITLHSSYCIYVAVIKKDKLFKRGIVLYRMNKIAIFIGEKDTYYKNIEGFLKESGYIPAFLKISTVNKIPNSSILELQPDLIIQQFSHRRMSLEGEYHFTEKVMKRIKNSPKNIALLVLDFIPKYDRAVKLILQRSHPILRGSKVQFSYNEMVWEKDRFMKYLTDEYWNAPSRKGV